MIRHSGVPRIIGRTGRQLARGLYFRWVRERIDVALPFLGWQLSSRHFVELQRGVRIVPIHREIRYTTGTTGKEYGGRTG